MKRSRAFNALLFVTAMLVAFGAYREMRVAILLKKEEGVQRAKVAELEKKRDELEKKILGLEHPEGVAREAKERLNLKKPGEEVVVVLPDSSASTSTVPRTRRWRKFVRALAAIFSF